VIKALNVIDLFSGCGGSALGFRQAGFRIKVALDIDPRTTKTFKLNFPESKVITSDVSYVSGSELLKAACVRDGRGIIVIACPPCQGFSSARRKSERLTDPRNMIIYEFLRIMNEIVPYAFVMENVPGLANGVGKPIFLNILHQLKSLGYYMIHGIVDTADYGIPQRRKRLVLIGVNDSKVRLIFPPKTNHDPNFSGRYLSPWITVKETIGDLPKIKAGEKSQTNPLHTAPNLSDLNLKRIKATPRNGGSRDSWHENLILECHKKIKGYKDIYGRMNWNRPSPTITAGCVMISKGRFGHPEQNRAISLQEAARLQTFPDSFVFTGGIQEIASQIGNAVPPLLARKIAFSLIKSIEESLNLESVLQKPIFKDESRFKFSTR